MSPSELFDIWAPPATTWSRWAKPILFAELGGVQPVDLALDPLPKLDLPVENGLGFVIDLPGSLSAKVGLSLLSSGIRPVPLYNGNRGPQTLDIRAGAVIDNDPIVVWLLAGARMMSETSLAFDAPPAFLLDARRKAEVSALPGKFDNRWMTFPQDFPSAAFLKASGITSMLVLTENRQIAPQEDLAHVLLRWQQGGTRLLRADLAQPRFTEPLNVQRPKDFRALLYRALAVAGLRRNSAGGFGSVVPVPGSSG